MARALRRNTRRDPNFGCRAAGFRVSRVAGNGHCAGWAALIPRPRPFPVRPPGPASTPRPRLRRAGAAAPIGAAAAGLGVGAARTTAREGDLRRGAAWEAALTRGAPACAPFPSPSSSSWACGTLRSRYLKPECHRCPGSPAPPWAPEEPKAPCVRQQVQHSVQMQMPPALLQLLRALQIKPAPHAPVSPCHCLRGFQTQCFHLIF